MQQIAASKTPGYAAMAERRLHRRHFPQTTLDAFTVLMVAPSERRRDALRKAIATKPGAALWRFVAASDLTPERFLLDPIFHPCDGEPVPLIKPGRRRRWRHEAVPPPVPPAVPSPRPPRHTRSVWVARS